VLRAYLTLVLVLLSFLQASEELVVAIGNRVEVVPHGIDSLNQDVGIGMIRLDLLTDDVHLLQRDFGLVEQIDDVVRLLLEVL
jgi:hypothetical protein